MSYQKEEKCPTCGSPDPRLHPALSYGGEVSICADAFHQTVTPQNTPERLAEVNALAAKLKGAPVPRARAAGYWDPRDE